jgi:hypothetical protein
MPPSRAADERCRSTSKNSNVRIKKDRRGEVEKSEVTGKSRKKAVPSAHEGIAVISTRIGQYCHALSISIHLCFTVYTHF